MDPDAPSRDFALGLSVLGVPESVSCLTNVRHADMRRACTGKGVRMRGQRGQHGRRTFWRATLALLVYVALVTPTGAEVRLTGAGATFPSALYAQWFTQYATVDGGVHIEYQAIGSGGGVKQLMEQTVAFGASDVPMT